MVYVPSYNYCPRCGNDLVETPHEVFGFKDPDDFFWGFEKEYIGEEDPENKD